MKKIIAGVLLLVLTVGLAFALLPAEREEREYLRVHIRANSNAAEDQAVKYEVRDAVVAYLTPTVAACGSKEEAVLRVGEALGGAVREAEKVLSARGFSYGARAEIRREEFPTRVYDGVTLDAGVYDALIIELGSGKGDNWWCVVYPPLCFTAGSAGVLYRSKIAEIIRKFFEEKQAA